MLTSTAFHAETAGPRLLVLGAVHGDEKCGTAAIKRIIPEFENGSLALLKGRVTFVPICNPRAYAENVRYIERNLNRNLLPQDVPDCYEAQLGNVLCPLLRDCDVLLDIHSYHVGGPSFTFIDPPNAQSIAFATALGADTAISNFAGATAASSVGTDKDANWSIGTTEYAERFGAMSVTFECGQHYDPQAPEIAYQGILGSLRYLGMIAGTTASRVTRHVRVERVIYRQDNGGSFTQSWKHLEPVKAGTIIATRSNGEVLMAEQDSILVLPRASAEAGAEWFYLGREAAIEA